jgi:hypothetical protein
MIPLEWQLIVRSSTRVGGCVRLIRHDFRMMRQSSIETTKKYCVGKNARKTAEAIWNAYPNIPTPTSGKGRVGAVRGKRGKKQSKPRTPK